MSFLDSATGLDWKVSEEGNEGVYKDPNEAYFPIYEGCSWDAVKLQWSANANKQEVERPAF